MTERLEFYDILGILVPGVLLIWLLALCFDVEAFGVPGTMPEAFVVVVLTALAIFLGQLIQALASLAQPLLEWTWGGRPSRRVFEEGLGDRYLSKSTARRIGRKLETCADAKQSPGDLFAFAMQQAENAGRTRAPRFNALYAYHRALLMLCILAPIAIVCSMMWGTLAGLDRMLRVALVSGTAGILALVWHRTKQRSLYYVGEVLLTAEREIDARTASSSSVALSSEE